MKQFREYVKYMYEVAAFRGKDKLKSVFTFADNDVVQESFLEDIQNMLNAGAVPNLYSADELTKIRDECRKPFKRANPGAIESPDAIQEFFFDNIKNNLHLSVCMSPIGRAFRDYTRMFPALINNTTLDWFMKWPDDALTEVAGRFIGSMELGEEVEGGLAKLCAVAHQSTQDNAELMRSELRRVFYVTPTNYVELLKGYGKILKENRLKVDAQRTKLRNGLGKLASASKQVEEMSKEAEVARAEVSKAQKVGEELMITIAKESKAADEQQVHIQAETVKIEGERKETLILAAEAEAELKKAEPALLAANEALEGLDKKHISEIKSFTSPPDAVATVMAAVMVVLGKDTGWATVKKELAAPDFVKGIMLFDKENIGPVTLKKIEKYTRMESFQPAAVCKVSTAAGALCQWCRSLEDYAKALKVVGPKRAKKAYAEEQLAKKLAVLQQLEADYNVLAARLAELNAQHEEAAAALAGYKRELDNLQVKIDRGERLVSGLAGEKTRWEAQVLELDSQYEKLIGDCILAAAFMSYCGPFPSEYRDGLISDWLSTVESERIPHTQGFDFADFMAGAAQARAW